MNVERDTKGRLIRPDFVSDLPSHLLVNASASEQYLMSQASIGRQQNEWVIQTTMEFDARHHRAEKELAELKTLRLILSGKWSVVFSILVLLIIPACLLAVGVWFERLFGTK